MGDKEILKHIKIHEGRCSAAYQRRKSGDIWILINTMKFTLLQGDFSTKYKIWLLYG